MHNAGTLQCCRRRGGRDGYDETSRWDHEREKLHGLACRVKQEIDRAWRNDLGWAVFGVVDDYPVRRQSGTGLGVSRSRLTLVNYPLSQKLGDFGNLRGRNCRNYFTCTEDILGQLAGIGASAANFATSSASLFLQPGRVRGRGGGRGETHVQRARRLSFPPGRPDTASALVER